MTLLCLLPLHAIKVGCSIAMPASTSQLLRESRFAPHFSIQPLPDGQDAKPVCPGIRGFLEVDPFEVISGGTVTIEGSSQIAKGLCCSSGQSCCSWLEQDSKKCHTFVFATMIIQLVLLFANPLPSCHEWICKSANASAHPVITLLVGEKLCRVITLLVGEKLCRVI